MEYIFKITIEKLVDKYLEERLLHNNENCIRLNKNIEINEKINGLKNQIKSSIRIEDILDNKSALEYKDNLKNAFILFKKETSNTGNYDD